MNVNSTSFIKILLISSALTVTLSANAQRHFQGRGGRWHGGDIRRFEVHDRGYWRGGYWRHGGYHGRFGWWWIVGPSWYYYDRPIYPYPDPYTPPVIIVPTQSQTQPAPAPVQYWYYCEASKEYYPYTDNCPAGWKAVPANPLNK